jgi:hypothetical protein
MLVHFGTGSYTLKSYTPLELGLPLNYTQDAEFNIKQKYFEIYWIPIFAIGMAYTVRHKGGTVDYVVSLEIEETMRQLSYPKWKKMLAFAAPLLALLIALTISIASEIEQANYASLSKEYRDAKIAQEKEFKEDPAGFATYAKQAEQYDKLLQRICDESTMELVEIDTTLTGMLRLVSRMNSRAEDAQNNYSLDNCIFYTASINERNTRESDIPKPWIMTAFSNHTQIMDHYMDYLLGKDSTLMAGSDVGDLKVAFDAAKNKEYFVVTNYKGLVLPELMSGENEGSFSSGVALANIKIYSISQSKLIENFDVIATNDDEINLHHRRKSGSVDTGTGMESKGQLYQNLQSNVQQLMLEELELSKKKGEEETIEVVQ